MLAQPAQDTGMVVTLVTTGENELTEQAMSQLRKLPNSEIRVSYCQPSVADWFECPFVRAEGGEEYFGLDGIKHFVSRRLARTVA